MKKNSIDVHYLQIIRLSSSLSDKVSNNNDVILNSDSCSLFFRTRAPYGEKKEKFVYALSLVFVQFFVNALFAEAGMLTRVNLLENYQPEC